MTTDSIMGPSQAHRVATADEYRAAALAFCRRHGVTALHDGADPQPVAYINQSRWLCDCTCGNAPSTHPDLPVACCFECGAVWRPVFPDAADFAEIHRVLLARPALARNYDPRRETIDHIAWENEHRGVV